MQSLGDADSGHDQGIAVRKPLRGKESLIRGDDAGGVLTGGDIHFEETGEGVGGRWLADRNHYGFAVGRPGWLVNLACERNIAEDGAIRPSVGVCNKEVPERCGVALAQESYPLAVGRKRDGAID